MATEQLSAREARRVQLVAQGLLGGGWATPGEVLEGTRGVQLDTISVLARSHELVAFARLGPRPRAEIEQAYWGGTSAFEYWYHAACILPLDQWPLFEFKRDDRRIKGFRWHRMDDPDRSCKEVLARVRADGPLTANELGGAKRGGPWWDWSETKIAAEYLLDRGDLVCTTRRGYQRVYDLPERAVPDALRGEQVGREEAITRLVVSAVGSLGLATAADLAAYVGVTRTEAAAALDRSGLVRASVPGWREEAALAPGALDAAAATGSRRSGPVLLSPFDSLLCDRERLERLFGFRHRLEAYVPRAKRVHGYYTMPVLSGDRFVGRVDPKRVGRTLVARAVHLEPGVAPVPAARAIGRALRRAAEWVGADQVVLERVEPASIGPTVREAAG